MNLRAEIICIFLGIVVVTITVASILFYYSSKSFLLDEIYLHLQSIAETKQQRLSDIIDMRREQIALLQNREMLSSNLSNYFNSGNSADLLKLRNSALRAKESVKSFKKIHVLDVNGRVITSTDSSYVGKSFSGKESFQEALAGKVAINSTYYDEYNKLIFEMAGLIYHENEPLGVIAADVYADEVVSLVMDFTGLGETGETTLVKEDKDGNAVYITPTRHFPVMGILINLKRDEKYESFKALDKDEGLHTNLLDYRDQEVIAATRHIPELHWGLTTKIDKEEAYKPIMALRNKIILLTLILFTLTIFFAYYFADYIIKPITEISMAAKQIAAGDYNQKVKVRKKNEVGEMAYLFNKMSDKLMKAHQKLNKKIEALNASNDNLQRFSYIVSHDLKSPLNNFVGLLNVLRKKYIPENDSQFKELVEMMVSKSNQMKGLIDGILHYSRAGTVGVAEQVDLNDLLKEVTGIIHIPEHIKVHKEPLPAILIDKVAITQVFMNLISNAVKFMDKAEGIIRIGYSKEDNYYRFYVQDNGPGILPENQKKVFELFNKVNVNTKVDSSGIGLSIVKKIIEGNGGEIWLESEVGKGTTFYFILPARPSEDH